MIQKKLLFAGLLIGVLPVLASEPERPVILNSSSATANEEVKSGEVSSHAGQKQKSTEFIKKEEATKVEATKDERNELNFASQQREAKEGVKESDKREEQDDSVTKVGAFVMRSSVSQGVGEAVLERVDSEGGNEEKELSVAASELLSAKEIEGTTEEQLKLLTIEKLEKKLSALQTPLQSAQNHYASVVNALNNINEEQNKCKIEKYLTSLGYSLQDEAVQIVLQQESAELDESEREKAFKKRMEAFNRLDFKNAAIRRQLLFSDLASELTTLFQTNNFKCINAPAFDQIYSGSDKISEWQKNIMQLLIGIRTDWQFINSCNKFSVQLEQEQAAIINYVINLLLPKMDIFTFCQDIYFKEKRKELIQSLELMIKNLAWLKEEFTNREREVNDALYDKEENIVFTSDYNERVSIQTMYDYLNAKKVSCERYKKVIDFIFTKFGRLTSQQCEQGNRGFIKNVKPIREFGLLTGVMGIISFLRKDALNGVKKSFEVLNTYVKNKEFKSALRCLLNKQNSGILLVGSGLALGCFGHKRTDSLWTKRTRYANVISALQKQYKKEAQQKGDE